MHWGFLKEIKVDSVKRCDLNVAILLEISFRLASTHFRAPTKFLFSSICCPYTPPQETYLSPEAIAEIVPSLAYQVYLAHPKAEIELDSNVIVYYSKNHIHGSIATSWLTLFS